MNCRIISVNAEKDELVEDFGWNKDEDGKKLRYRKRRKYIESFLKDHPNIDIKIFDAITPNCFSKVDKFDEYGNLSNTIIKDVYANYNDIIIDDIVLPIKNPKEIFYISNVLSHYKIWNLDEDTLILEDDIILDEDILNNVFLSIQEFEKIDGDNKLLYLLASTPWEAALGDKRFNKKNTNGIISEIGDEDMFVTEVGGGDFTGTAAYYLKKECKKIILDNMFPLCACDQYLDDLRKREIIKYYVPNNINSMIRLNKDLAWL